MNAESPIAELFPDAIPEKVFVKRSLSRLERHGFTADNTIACVGTCRDEVCASFARATERVWGEAFNFASLAGFPFLGKTGFDAARSHAPIFDDKERYVFFALPHIGVTQAGIIGSCHRAGREETSPACGALDAIRLELEGGSLRSDLDLEDIEMSMVRRLLSPAVAPGTKPELLELTHLALGVITRELERLITLRVGSKRADYGVFTGVQINAPEGNWVLPAKSYAVVDWATISLDKEKGGTE